VGTQHSADEQFAALKSFLTNRPAVEMLLVKRYNTMGAEQLAAGMRGIRGLPASSRIIDWGPYFYYRAAFQNEDYWLKQVRSPTEPFDRITTNQLTFIGCFSNITWQVQGEIAIKYVRPPGNTEIVTNEIAMKAPQAVLREMMSFGLVWQIADRIDFHDRRFTVIRQGNPVFDGEFRVEGKRVISADMHLIGSGRRALLTFSYDTKADVPWFFPAAYTLQYVSPDGGVTNTVSKGEYLMLKLATNRLPDSYFLPDRLYSNEPRNPTREVFYTNEGYYYK
jgi:hypothetical protein